MKRLSISLSVPSTDTSSGVWWVCCWAPVDRRYRSIAANVGSVVLTAKGETEHRLVNPCSAGACCAIFVCMCASLFYSDVFILLLLKCLCSLVFAHNRLNYEQPVCELFLRFCMIFIVISFFLVILPFRYRLSQVFLDRRPLNGCFCHLFDCFLFSAVSVVVSTYPNTWIFGIHQNGCENVLVYLLLQATTCFSAVGTKTKTSTSMMNGVCWRQSRYWSCSLLFLVTRLLHTERH